MVKSSAQRKRCEGVRPEREELEVWKASCVSYRKKHKHAEDALERLKGGGGGGGGGEGRGLRSSTFQLNLSRF
jgi:hypothetical protein